MCDVQGGMWTAVHIPPCTEHDAHTNTGYAATSHIILEYS